MQNNSTIKPADISLTRESLLPGEAEGKYIGRSALIWAMLAVLAALVFCVIFILPDWLNNSPATTASAPTGNGTTGTAATTPPTATGNLPSPWSEAQLAKQRDASQNVLSQMLKQQDALEHIGVKQWAAKEYAAAVKFAESGDAYYRQRKFTQAQDSYQKTLDEFNRLLQQSKSVFTKAMAKGNRAIEEGDSSAAKSAFKLALLIKPDDASARKGSKRAASLDQVMQFLDQGDKLLQAGRLQDAEAAYLQALHLDPDNNHASEKLAHTRQKIIDQKFNTAMSNGYAALENNKLEDARRDFEQAIRIKPSTAEARNALHQTDDKLTVIKINKLLSSAARKEHSEQWADAVNIYDQALKLDPNLTAAQTGEQNASLRERLDKSLKFAIDNPLRLANDTIYTETRTLYLAALKINRPGPKLRDQLSTLKRQLNLARKPLSVTFQSDNLTDITLYKTGDLGHFTSRQVALIPGHYIVVGRRDGYQDVRVEFTLNPDKPIKPIIVQCKDKIPF